MFRQLARVYRGVESQLHEVTMPFGTFKNLVAGILFLSAYAFVGNTVSFAQCPILNVMVKGEVQSPPRGGVVRVQLVYSKHPKD